MISKEYFAGSENAPPDYPNAKLEKAFIKEFLASKGYELVDLKLLTKEIAFGLRKEACSYASKRLTEIETRSKLVQAIHG
jgi:hypothetical protein